MINKNNRISYGDRFCCKNSHMIQLESVHESYFNRDHDFCFSQFIKHNPLHDLPAGYDPENISFHLAVALSISNTVFSTCVKSLETLIFKCFE